jgi:hypothetical protein
VLDGDQRRPRSCQLERLAHGDAPHPPVDGGGLAQGVEVLQHLDHRLLHGVIPVLERDGAADPPDVGERARSSAAMASGSPRWAARTSSWSSAL